MSWDALSWAAKCKVGKAADKLILLALAERHNPESGVAYPSVAWLADFSSLDRKTVMAALDRLEAVGLISDSGDRVGKTNQVKAYKLHLETVPKTEQSQKRNSTGIPAKQSQKRNTDTVREPVGSEAKASSPRAKSGFILPADIPPEPWADFVEMRKRMGKAMTVKAMHLAVGRLRKLRDEDGWPPGDVLNNSTLNSYQGLFPPKERRHERSSNPLGDAVRNILRTGQPHCGAG